MPPATEGETDALVRAEAFRFLGQLAERFGGAVPRATLAQGFTFKGERVPLVGPQGIFKPQILPEMPLTITTVPVVEGRARPYEDELAGDGTLIYRYRGTDPGHRDNVGLRLAMARRAPLAYLFGLVPGQYQPVWPVFIVGDDAANLAFHVAVDDHALSLDARQVVDIGAEARRRYITQITQRRLHQAGFRKRVLRAYRVQCAICRLKHEELLDAAHILPDGHPRGEPVVSNGVALCCLHHAAFDRHVVGIRPDLVVEIRPDILEEVDGPMLKHGLQELHGTTVHVPGHAELRPDREFLAERYEMFRMAG